MDNNTILQFDYQTSYIDLIHLKQKFNPFGSLYVKMNQKLVQCSRRFQFMRFLFLQNEPNECFLTIT
jgi:hypothetical protein